MDKGGPGGLRVVVGVETRENITLSKCQAVLELDGGAHQHGLEGREYLKLWEKIASKPGWTVINSITDVESSWLVQIQSAQTLERPHPRSTSQPPGHSTFQW